MLSRTQDHMMLWSCTQFLKTVITALMSLRNTNKQLTHSIEKEATLMLQLQRRRSSSVFCTSLKINLFKISSNLMVS